MRTLEEIERDAAAATPGKLYTCVPFGAHPDDLRATTIVNNAGEQVADCLDNRKVSDVQAIADATFFANARTDVPELVERVRQLEKKIDDARTTAHRIEQRVRYLPMQMHEGAALADEFEDLERSLRSPFIEALARGG